VLDDLPGTFAGKIRKTLIAFARAVRPEARP
jgi:hypothetical protein